jgi:hypothetical protein
MDSLSSAATVGAHGPGQENSSARETSLSPQLGIQI